MGKGFWIGTIIVVIILGITAGIIVHVYGDERTERATLKQANELARMKEANLNDKANKNGRNNGKNGNGENNNYYDNNENSNDVENSVILKTSSGEEKTTPNTLIIFESYYSKCGHSKIRSEKIANEYVENGYVTVYNINKDGQEVLSDKTDISTKYLPKDDNDLLKNGIKANSTSQLEQILADFE